MTVAAGVIGTREKKEAHSSGSTLHFSRRPEKGEPPRRALRPAFMPDESVSHGHCPYDSQRAYAHASTHIPRTERRDTLGIVLRVLFVVLLLRRNRSTDSFLRFQFYWDSLIFFEFLEIIRISGLDHLDFWTARIKFNLYFVRKVQKIRK